MKEFRQLFLRIASIKCKFGTQINSQVHVNPMIFIFCICVHVSATDEYIYICNCYFLFSSNEIELIGLIYWDPIPYVEDM